MQWLLSVVSLDRRVTWIVKVRNNPSLTSVPRPATPRYACHPPGTVTEPVEGLCVLAPDSPQTPFSKAPQASCGTAPSPAGALLHSGRSGGVRQRREVDADGLPGVRRCSAHRAPTPRLRAVSLSGQPTTCPISARVHAVHGVTPGRARTAARGHLPCLAALPRRTSSPPAAPMRAATFHAAATRPPTSVPVGIDLLGSACLPFGVSVQGTGAAEGWTATAPPACRARPPTGARTASSAPRQYTRAAARFSWNRASAADQAMPSFSSRAAVAGRFFMRSG